MGKFRNRFNSIPDLQNPSNTQSSGAVNNSIIRAKKSTGFWYLSCHLIYIQFILHKGKRITWYFIRRSPTTCQEYKTIGTLFKGCTCVTCKINNRKLKTRMQVNSLTTPTLMAVVACSGGMIYSMNLRRNDFEGVSDSYFWLAMHVCSLDCEVMATIIIASYRLACLKEKLNLQV